ncbi:hypothetical protein HPB47_005828 [Ixodes persulcatus]|uniref:Uncharacterized protein n=1 Tax=Ixodes persulcatus TaxID=34615 RepID=A0AC60PCI9_IXOPE|nr:hypothetical protein HPB47_005828 [Ixodes persulcatus]
MKRICEFPYLTTHRVYDLIFQQQFPRERELSVVQHPMSWYASSSYQPVQTFCPGRPLQLCYLHGGGLRGRTLLFSDNSSFERFKERARGSRTGSWGVSLRPEDAMSGEKGVWGEHKARFLAALQELLTESRLSVFGMADVHLTTADFIDTTQEYIDFFKASFVDLFIYQTHHLPDHQDDDALRILSPPIVARNKFRLVLSLSMSLLRFTMKGPDIEEIRRPCRSMALLPFTEMSDVLRELQQRGMDVNFAAFHVEHEDQRGECGRSFHRLWIMTKCLRDIARRRKGTTRSTSQAMFPYYSQ